jgi:flagellar biosynthesis component FlhA
METIQKIVLENIFRKKDEIKYKTVEKLVDDLIVSDDPNFTQAFCAIDFKVVQRIANSIEEIVNNINEDIEPYWLAVSEHGRDCLHQIA